ncbi:MAG: FKBP-type peptidyl-prolyl cis-trans isomerase [Pseudomonadales bacterium]
MELSKDRVGVFHYTLSNLQQETLESSHDGDPQVYLHGAGNIMPALERALEGKSEGDHVEVTLDAIDAYGLRKDDMIQRMPVKHLRPPKGGKLKSGGVAAIETKQGLRQVKIVKMGKFQATVDANHPLAGETLNFIIDISRVREANADELAHGHPHGEDGNVSH